MATGTTVKSLMFDIKGNVEAALNTKLARMDGQLKQITDSTDILRNSFLFLSFGLLAAGGMMTRFGKQLQGYADSARDAFASVDWLSSIVSTTMMGTNEVVGEVREEMLRLGRDTQWTATQAGEAMQRLALAGFNVDETIGGAEAVLRLATIGLTDTTTAANLAVGVFRGFGYEVKDSAEAAEVMTGIVSELAYAATHSATTVEELGEALKFAAASADLVGWTLEEVTSILMVAADSMVRAGIAGRALRRSFVQMNKLALAAQGITMSGTEAMKKYGIQLLDAGGEMKGMIEVVEELTAAFEGVAEAERNAALAAMFGTRAITLWSAIMRPGALETLKEHELALKVAAAKDVLYERSIYNTTEQLKRWRAEMAEGTDYLQWFMDEMGMNIDTAILFNEIVKDTTLSQDKWNEIVKDTSRASAITAERLTTLHGTMILLQSSIDTMWAAIGKELAPYLEWWNTLLKQIADSIAQLPGWLKLIIGLLVIFGATAFTLVGKIMTLAGSVFMLVAALVVMKKSQVGAVSTNMLMVEGLKLLHVNIKKAIVHVASLAMGYVILAGKIAITLGTIYLFHKAAQDTGNNLYYLAMVVILAAQAYWIMNQAQRDALRTKIVHLALMIKEKVVSIALTIIKYAEAAATWAQTSAWWALTVAMLSNPMFWFIGLFVALLAILTMVTGAIDVFIGLLRILGDAIMGFVEGVGGALQWIADRIGDLIGNSVIPDHFKRGTKEIGKSLDELRGQAVGTMKELESGLSTTFAPEVTGIGARGGGNGSKRIAIVHNTFGNVSLGGGMDAERFGAIVGGATRDTLRRLKFDLSTAIEGE